MFSVKISLTTVPIEVVLDDLYIDFGLVYAILTSLYVPAIEPFDAMT